MSTPKIEVRPTPDAVAEAAAEHFVAACHAALEEKETFTVALAGGSTPKAMYRLLAGDGFRHRVEWNRVEIFFGDERTVPPDHADSNFRMAREALLDHVPIPGDNVTRMKGELEPQEAAYAYATTLEETFGDTAGLDMLLLGMGDDSHTLSLFPHTRAIDETEQPCVANHVPKLDTWRITLTAPFANRSEQVLALVTGENKAEAMRNVLEGPDDPATYPMQLIQPTSGRHFIYCDSAAAGMAADDD
jgi:6-phosphogluconolactonase